MDIQRLYPDEARNHGLRMVKKVDLFVGVMGGTLLFSRVEVCGRQTFYDSSPIPNVLFVGSQDDHFIHLLYLHLLP